MKKMTIAISIAAGLIGLGELLWYLWSRDENSTLKSHSTHNEKSTLETEEKSESCQITQVPLCTEVNNSSADKCAAKKCFPKAVHSKTLYFYRVLAKGGHVGQNFYLRVAFYCRAESAKKAAEFVRQAPRVKHTQKDAILSVKKVSEEEYRVGCREMRENPFFHCKNIQEQRALMNDFILKNRIPEEEKKRYSKKRHSLRNSLHDDLSFYSWKTFKGNVSLEEIFA